MGRILCVDLEKKIIRWEEKVVITRQNTTNDTEKEQQQETKFKRRIPGEYWKYHNTIFDKRIFNKIPLWKSWDYAIEIILGASLRDYKA